MPHRAEWFVDTSTTYIPVLAIAYTVSYYKKYREEEMQALKLDAQLANAQLKLLRSQLNPHFLFNALHSIGSLMHFNVYAADEMISKLSELLRFALAQTTDIETELRDELHFVDCYLEIERIRLGSRLKVTRNIGEAALDARIPPLILQPLIENAVIHGVAQQPGGGEVYIEARRTNDNLKIIVRNDGTMKPPRFRPPGRDGLGLRNIRERLVQLYGEHHLFRIFETTAGKVTVNIFIPWRTCDDVPIQPPLAHWRTHQ